MSNRIALDLKAWKHVKSDDHTTTLQHKDGHQLTIAHKNMGAEHKEQLNALKQLSNAEETQPQKQEAKQESKEMCSGGPVKMADGGVPTVENPLQVDLSPPHAPTEAEKIAQSNEEALQFLQNPMGALATPVNAPSRPIFPTGANIGAMTGYKAPDAVAPEQAAEEPQAATEQPAAPPAQNEATKGESAPGMDTYESMVNKGLNLGLSSADAAAKAQADLGTARSKQLDETIKAQQTAQTEYQKHYDTLETERQALEQDVKNGHIDPEKYWDNHSKIAAGIGMILAGFNPTNSPNAAVDFLNKQMDRDLQAQARNLTEKNNLLAHNLRQFGNLRDAADFTRIQNATIAAAQMDQAAANAQGPMAKAAAMQAKSALIQQYAPMMQQLSLRRAMMGTAASGQPGSEQAVNHMLSYLRVMNPKMAEEMSSRVVPGVGMSQSVAVPEAVRQQIVATKSVNDLMNDALSFTAQHKGVLSKLSPEERAKANTIQMQLIGAIKQAQHDGVYKPSEAEFLLSQIGGSPASFLAGWSSTPKIQQLQAIKQQEYGNLLKTYGIVPFAGQNNMLPTAQGSQPAGQPKAIRFTPIKGK